MSTPPAVAWKLTSAERDELANAALTDTCGDIWETHGEVQKVTERIVRERLSESGADS